jgi:flagellar hook assembly protein FlgD
MTAVTKLKGNYPNPFNPTTDIAFSVNEVGNVKIEVFNVKGQKVKTLVDETRSAGSYNVTWNGLDDNGNDVTSGVYFYRMDTESYSKTNKMILLK